MCTLRVTGESFDARGFLAVSSLDPAVVWERGKPHPVRRSKASLCQTSGFNVGVSNAGWDALAQQCAEAVAFLHRHEPELRRLEQLGTAKAELDFPVWARPEERNVIIWSEQFPPELLRAAGSLGIAVRVTLYFGSAEATPNRPPADET